MSWNTWSYSRELCPQPVVFLIWGCTLHLNPSPVKQLLPAPPHSEPFHSQLLFSLFSTNTLLCYYTLCYSLSIFYQSFQSYSSLLVVLLFSFYISLVFLKAFPPVVSLRKLSLRAATAFERLLMAQAQCFSSCNHICKKKVHFKEQIEYLSPNPHLALPR